LCLGRPASHGRQLLRAHILGIDGLFVEQSATDSLGLGSDPESPLPAEAPDLLAALVAHQVGRPASFVSDFPIRRDLEPFLHPFVGLELGHAGIAFFRLGPPIVEAGQRRRSTYIYVTFV
jgi:hypothetical protein